MAKVKVDYEFDIEVFDTNKPTESNNLYTVDTIRQIDSHIKNGGDYIVQEYCPIEREMKHIKPDEVWPERIMAKVISSEIRDGKLYMHAKCVDGRYGKKLMNICENMGLESIKFYPVGYGVPTQAGGCNIITNYKLIYIAF